jgi:hypothetical protein
MTVNPQIRFGNTSSTIVAEQGARGAGQDVWTGWCGITTDSPQWSTIEVPKITDARGSLSVIEFKRGVPFNIERIYYVYNVPWGSQRGGHAHKSLHQILLAPSGSFTIHLDNGAVKTTITLNQPHIGLYIGPGVWRVVDHFSYGAVCLVLASEHFDESEYIRTYPEFEIYIAQRRKPPVRIDPTERPTSCGPN